MKIARALASLTASPYHKVEFQSGQLIGNIQDGAVCNALVGKHFEDYGYYQLAEALIPYKGTHVDLGANYGFHTFGLLDQPKAKSARHLLIDANPDCVYCHNLSIQLYPDCKLKTINYAVGQFAGRVYLSYNPEMSGTGFLGKSENKAPNLQSVEVPCQTMDFILSEEKIDIVDLLKIDIEGSETSALRGAHNYLSRQAIRSIYFEVNLNTLLQQNTCADELFQLLEGYGYQLFWPHDSMEWILAQYNNPKLTSKDIRIIEYKTNKTLQIAEFNRQFFKAETGKQFDLLAFPQPIAASFQEKSIL